MYKVMNNGCKIPMVGLGCFKAGEESLCQSSGNGNLSRLPPL